MRGGEKAFLPFAASRLSDDLQAELSAAEHPFLFEEILAPVFVALPSLQQPDYLVLTSANGVRAAQNLGWERLSVFCIGSQTGQLAKAAGFGNVQVFDPPAPNLLPFLPPAPSMGLWLSGEEVAHDLDQLDGPHQLRRCVAYTIETLPALQKVIKPALAKDKIRSMFVTSSRMIREMARLMANVQPDVHMGPTFAVALSERLASHTRDALPTLQGTEVVPCLDSGVRVLLQHMDAKRTP